jgi:hypothetical protein
MPAQSDNPYAPIELVQWPEGGINQSTRRSTIGDVDCWWLENFFPLADGELRTAWGPSAPIYTAPPGLSILRIFLATLNGTDVYCYNFMSDGTIRAVNVATGAVTNLLGAQWGPTTPPYYADLKVWTPTQVGNTTGQIGGLLIGSPAGYYAVDANFTVTGPGATAPAWLTGGATPPGGGSFVMPSGLPGIYSLEVYNQRMWVQGQTVHSFSAPENGADFSAAGGGGSYPYNGDQLTVSFMDQAATAGFLYQFGDSMTQWLSNIQLVGQVAATTNPPSVTQPFTTQFQLSNYNPQIGQRFPRPVGKWLQALAVYDLAGVYLLDGSGQMTWLTQKVNNTWVTIDPANPIPTCCPVHVFGQRWLLFNGTYTDPWKVNRNLILAWNGQIWTATSQRYNLTNINYHEQDSCITAYGTDGNVLVQLFAQPDPQLEKRLSTKAYNNKNSLMIKNWKRAFVHLHDMAGEPEGSFITGTFSTEGGGIPNGSEQVSFEVQPNTDDMKGHPLAGQGIFGWLDLRSNSPDFIIERVLLASEDRTLYGA